MLIKTLIVDDHELVRAGVRLILHDIQPDMDIHEASCAREVQLKMQREIAFDLVIMDLAIPDRDGLALLKQIKTSHKHCPIVVVATEEDQATIQRTMQQGAFNYIPKSSEAAHIRRELKAAVDFAVQQPRKPTRPQGDFSRRRQLAGHIPRVELTEDMIDVINSLTRRQKEVLELLAAGKTNKEICATLKLSGGTVKNHVTAILSTLGVNRRTKVALLAREYASKIG